MCRGRRNKQYDESLAVYERASKDGTLGLEALDFGRRAAVERELEESESLNMFNAVYDESDNFLIFPTIVGIKIVSLNTNAVVRTLGRVENAQRFLSVELYQGIPRVDTQYMLAKSGGATKYGSFQRTIVLVTHVATLLEPPKTYSKLRHPIRRRIALRSRCGDSTRFLRVSQKSSQT